MPATRDPDAALLYVVPIYANAALQPSVKGRSCNGTQYQALLDRTASAVEATAQYARNHGSDHVLVRMHMAHTKHGAALHNSCDRIAGPEICSSKLC